MIDRNQTWPKGIDRNQTWPKGVEFSYMALRGSYRIWWRTAIYQNTCIELVEIEMVKDGNGCFKWAVSVITDRHEIQAKWDQHRGNLYEVERDSIR